MALTPAAAIEEITADQAIFHAIVNGPANGAGSIVATESGNVSTIAKAIADANASLDATAAGVSAAAAAASATAAAAVVGNQGRNRIINGDMRIDQRLAGGTVTPVGGGVFSVDRWTWDQSQIGKVTMGQNYAAASNALNGFPNYLGLKVTTAYSVVAADHFGILQYIEGLNISDLAWGTANAKQITVSFWVYCSQTGNRSASIRGTGPRSYLFTYNIAVANTWTKITVTIPGDTGGVWPTDNSIGLGLYFSLGVGTTFSGAANAWSSGNLFSVTGTGNLLATLNAVFAVTGVQLEAGAAATPFEVRDYASELLRCQRYFEKTYSAGVASGSVTTSGALISLHSVAGAPAFIEWDFSAPKRTSAVTLDVKSTGSGSSALFQDTTAVSDVSAFAYLGNDKRCVFSSSSNATVGHLYACQATANAEL